MDIDDSVRLVWIEDAPESADVRVGKQEADEDVGVPGPQGRRHRGTDNAYSWTTL